MVGQIIMVEGRGGETPIPSWHPGAQKNPKKRPDLRYIYLSKGPIGSHILHTSYDLPSSTVAERQVQHMTYKGTFPIKAITMPIFALSIVYGYFRLAKIKTL